MKKKILGNDKYITTPKFNKLTNENIDERLKQRNLASESYISEFIKKTGFAEKLRKVIDIVTSNNTKDVETGKKLHDHITSYTKLINDLSGEVKLISGKVLTKDLISGYSISILNGAKYFSEDGSQNHWVFHHYIDILQH